MPSDTFELFRNAVLSKRRVSFLYQNHQRETCPHAVEWKNGREQVMVFQFGGDSSKGLPPGGEWRCFPIVGIANAQLANGPWITADNHSRPQTCVDQIAAEVTY